MRLLRQKLRKKCLVSWCAENPPTPCVGDSHTLCVCVCEHSQERCCSSTHPALCSMTAAAIEQATRSWIKHFVIRERLCPFAAASRILVRVDPLVNRADKPFKLDLAQSREHADIAMMAILRAESEVRHLIDTGARDDASSNLFLVWPNGLDDLQTYKAFASAIAQRTQIPLAGETGEGCHSDAAVAFPFHPNLHGRDDYRFASPWPMLHIIPHHELQRARRQLKEKKAAGKGCLLQRNLRHMRDASAVQREQWEQQLSEYRRLT